MICIFWGILLAISSAMAANKERTFIMVKPDGVQRGLVGEIIKRFEAKGFKLVALKLTWVSAILIELKISYFIFLFISLHGHMAPFLWLHFVANKVQLSL